MSRSKSLSKMILVLSTILLFTTSAFAQEVKQENSSKEQTLDVPKKLEQVAEPIKATVVEENQAVDKTVTQVVVVGSKNVPVDSFEQLFRVKPGATLTIENVNQDLQMIYETGWFYDVQARYSSVPEGIRVEYVVNENPILKKVEIVGCTIYSDNLLKRLLGLEDNQVINSKKLSEGARAIEAAYNRDGYILARVSDINMQPDGMMKVSINEGVIEGFVVKGNKKTKDYVILRELKLYKDEPFNVNDARRSMQKVYNLGYFEDVNIKLNPGRNPNGAEVEVSVVEMSTGTFGIGAGYSDADGIIGMIMIGDKNFRGIGDKINLRWEFGGANNKNYDFLYQRPWLDSKATAIGFNIYDVTHKYEELDDFGNDKAYYDRRRKGVEVTLSRPENDYITNAISLRHRNDIYVKPVERDHNQYYEANPWAIPDSFGKTNSVVLTRYVDTRDNIYNPTRGNYAQFQGEFAGFMGGDFSFNKYFVEARTYYPMTTNKVLAFRAVAGYATGKMPVSQRFSIGGDTYLRGYKDDRFYGYKMIAGTAEYRFPMTKNFQGVLFTDAGYAWEKGRSVNLGDIEYGYGVGLRINSPLGPIKLDYAYGDKWRIHFSFGGQF